MTFLSSPSTKRLVLFVLAPFFVFLICLAFFNFITPTQVPVEVKDASPAADTDVSSADTDVSSADTDVSPSTPEAPVAPSAPSAPPAAPAA